MKCSLGIALIIAVSLASCAKQPITKVSVKVDDAFSGPFRLTICVPETQDPVILNETAGGSTSACPSGDVEIAVIKSSSTYRIPPENVQVRKKTGGTPVVISAEIP